MSENTMDTTNLYLTEEQFEERFTLLESPQGTMVWEPEEITSIRLAEPYRIWTWVDGGDDEEPGDFEDDDLDSSPSISYLLSGTKFVNRYGYAVTVESAEPNTEYTVRYEH